jgi:hypothetical protein
MKKREESSITSEKGQTLIEFVLLLAAIGIISVTFMTQINKYTANRWLAMAQIILDDPTQTLQLK